MHYSIEPRDLLKTMDFYFIGKTEVVDTAKTFLTVLKNLRQVQ